MSWKKGWFPVIFESMPIWWPLLRLLSWCPVFISSHCNACGDWASVDLVYRCPIFKWVADIWLQGTRTLVPVMATPCSNGTTLQWRHNERDGIPDHQSHDCLLNRLFRHRSKKISKLRVTGLCAGNSPVTDEFPAQKASNAENLSIWWRHHESFRR